MTPLDRYLHRATRGLWGQRRRQVQQELRGAVEDKIWRYTLAGHEPAEAERFALRDLGDAPQLARAFRAVHVMPQRLQIGLALSLAALLSLQVQVTAQVSGAPYTPASVSCDYSPSGLKRLERDFGAQTALQERLKTTTPTQLERQCLQTYRTTSDALDYPSLLQVLRKQGVTIHHTPPAQTGTLTTSGDTPPAGSVWLQFPGAPVQTRLDPPARTPDGRQVMSQQYLIQSLLTSGLRVSLTGDVNPRLTVGGTSFTLGTAAAPVLTSDLYTGAIYLQLSALVQRPGHVRPLRYLHDPAAAVQPFNEPPALMASRLAPGTLVSGLLRSSSPSGEVSTALFTTRVGPGDSSCRVAGQRPTSSWWTRQRNSRQRFHRAFG
ncbi:permease prefix domain 1-containing protein (plasmid) [Deinococcus sp. KNUC1210]|uniref:permease prefix domain 1-containing protein n=1 Tax=Deinococcus sp. KNUC1210 TaxID=2917691 RepID=UPI001EF0C5AB|nr:permease prefix domain 1-containing protein [Deinococcus sp. KNUC1210]ULH13987.1 permease prefix domain 1-containing protein [Deinococcus sp. KNUC1210]